MPKCVHHVSEHLLTLSPVYTEAGVGGASRVEFRPNVIIFAITKGFDTYNRVPPHPNPSPLMGGGEQILVAVDHCLLWADEMDELL